jgi:MFS family permease
MSTYDQIGAQVIRKVKWHIIPIAFILYFFNGMDRVNVSYAALTMNKALNISSVMFGTISSVFFIAYLLFQIPSNILVQRKGINKLIPTITIIWGAITSLTFFAQSGTHVATLRFLLGLAEAGFFPGMVFYFTLWFPARERAQVMALFFLSGPVSGLFASPISGWIVQHANWLGYEGWRWLFAIEGIPTILLGFFAYAILKDGPHCVKWLNKEESEWLSNELNKEKMSHGKVSH